MDINIKTSTLVILRSLDGFAYKHFFQACPAFSQRLNMTRDSYERNLTQNHKLS